MVEQSKIVILALFTKREVRWLDIRISQRLHQKSLINKCCLNANVTGVY